MTHLLANLPLFLAYATTAIVLMGIFVLIYTFLTPHKEFTLIKQGNVAASISLSGAILGFVLALSSVVRYSISLMDMAVWGVVALLVQVVAYLCVRLLMPTLSQGIENNNISKGILLATIAVSFGLINAACMVY